MNACIFKRKAATIWCASLLLGLCLSACSSDSNDDESKDAGFDVSEDIRPDRSDADADADAPEDDGYDLADSIEPMVTDVEISPSTAALRVGDTLELQATSYDTDPDNLFGDSATWSSSDAAVVTVENSNGHGVGLLTAISEGSATITAEVEGVQATIEVTVAPFINTPPTANAGDGGTVETGEEITLDASASTDPDTGQTLSFSWSLLRVPGNSSTLLNNSTGEQVSFTVDVAGEYEAELTVNDGMDTATDTVLYLAEDPL